jgi:hypothetical protein
VARTSAVGDSEDQPEGGANFLSPRFTTSLVVTLRSQNWALLAEGCRCLYRL